MSEWLSLAAGTGLLMAVACGWGALASMALGGVRRPRDPLPAPFDGAPLGFAALYLLGALANFALPLTATVSDVAIAVGLAGCVAAFRRGGWRRHEAIRAVQLALPLALFVAWGAMRTPLGYDTGLYHLQHLLWLRAEPLPFGLAQLHERFGYNSAWMTIAALVGGSRVHGDATFLVGSALSATVLGSLLTVVRDAISRRRIDFTAGFAALAVVLLLSSGADALFSWFAQSPSNDVPAALLTIYVLVTGARLLRARFEEPRAALLAAFASSAALAATVKLSQAPIVPAMAGVLAWRHVTSTSASTRRAVRRAASAAAVLFAVWMAQNLALSGCLAFPRAATCVETLPWTLKARAVEHADFVIRAWARAPGPDFDRLATRADWPRAWVGRMLPERPFLPRLGWTSLGLAAALLAVRAWARRSPRIRGAPAAPFWVLVVAGLTAAVALWAAPDPRFVLGPLVALAAGTLTRLVPTYELPTPRHRRRVAVAVTVGIVAAAAVGWESLPSSHSRGPAWRDLPDPPTTTRALDGGLEIRVPRQGDQCWAVSPPCTPEAGRALRAARRWGRVVFVPSESAFGSAASRSPGPLAWAGARWRLLGLEVVPLAGLVFDFALLTFLAAWAARRLLGDDRPAGPRLLATALLAIAGVVVTATALGAASRLSHLALVGVLRVAAGGLLAAGLLRHGAKRWGREIAATAAFPVAPARAALAAAWRRREGGCGPRFERGLLAALAVALGFFALLAVGTQPLNWDAQAYRLSRVALWLQQGSLAHLPTNDARLNFVGHDADLVMLWVVSYFRSGFPLVHLVQFVSGLLLCVATSELGAFLGLSRRERLAAALVVVGIPAVGLQFFTAQTDLFVAGTLAAGLAFLPPALRHGRGSDWALVGVGVGLAVGAKATVLYWGPGLLALAVAWALVERRLDRRAIVGALFAGAIAFVLCGFNFVQNGRTYGNPFAAPSTFAFSHLSAENTAVSSSDPVEPDGGGDPPASAATAASPLGLGSWRSNLLAMAWQLLMPQSNPLLPASWLSPPFDALLDRLAVASFHYDQVRRSLVESDGWSAHGLSEDEASFGLLVPLLAAIAGLSAGLRLVRRRGDASDARWAAMALAVALFVLVFGATSVMSIYQYRYFCLLGPFVALLAVAAWRRRSEPVRDAAVALLAASQFLVALHLGRQSEYHGWSSFVDPRRSQYDFLWSEPRALVEQLGSRPISLGLFLPRDAWIAPYTRGAVGHRVRLLTLEEMASTDSLAEALERFDLDAIVVAPEFVLRVGEGLRALPSPRALGRYRRLAFRPLREGEVERPVVLDAFGVLEDGWTWPEAKIRVAAWSGPLTLRVLNPAPFSRRVELQSTAEERHLETPRESSTMVTVEMERADRLRLRIAPPFVPAETYAQSRDHRALGVRIPPRLTALDGVDADGWTRAEATVGVENWLAGTVALELLNPAPFARDVELESSVEHVRVRLAAGGLERLEIAVRPGDELGLAVSPIFHVDTRENDADRRPLGVLLSPASRRLLELAPP